MWINRATLLYTTERDGAQLEVAIVSNGPFDWVLLALEAKKTATTNTKERFDEVLAEHAHAVLEPQSSLRKAMDLAERYGKWWRGSRASHFDCACDEIATE
jgi:hypothetical protein